MIHPIRHDAEHRLALARWVARGILPYDARGASWSRVAAHDADELIQEAYCGGATLEAVDHIDLRCRALPHGR